LGNERLTEPAANVSERLTAAVERLADTIERQARLRSGIAAMDEPEAKAVPAAQEAGSKKKIPSLEDAKEIAELADQAYAQIKRRRRKKAQP